MSRRSGFDLPQPCHSGYCCGVRPRSAPRPALGQATCVQDRRWHRDHTRAYGDQQDIGCNAHVLVTCGRRPELNDESWRNIVENHVAWQRPADLTFPGLPGWHATIGLLREVRRMSSRAILRLVVAARRGAARIAEVSVCVGNACRPSMALLRHGLCVRRLAFLRTTGPGRLIGKCRPQRQHRLANIDSVHAVYRVKRCMVVSSQ